MSMKGTLLVLVHGWGFDREFWNPLRAGLAEALPCVATLALDLGFFGRPRLPVLPDGFARRIGVGHSLGLLRLLAGPPLGSNGEGGSDWLPGPYGAAGTAGLAGTTWPEGTAGQAKTEGAAGTAGAAALDGLVSLAGFPRFARSADFPRGVHPRLVRSMAARLATEPETVLRDFRLACGLGEAEGLPAGPPDPARLAQGLDWLLDLDGRPGLDAFVKQDGRSGPNSRPGQDDRTGPRDRPEPVGPAAAGAAIGRSPGRAPILALAAADDRIVPEAMSRAAFGARPSVRLEIRPDGGHALPWTRPAWCAERIAAWLEQPDLSGRKDPEKDVNISGTGGTAGRVSPGETPGPAGTP
jgi:pimeloyl-[acyl-carrier protein] methyl ester esterase